MGDAIEVCGIAVIDGWRCTFQVLVEWLGAEWAPLVRLAAFSTLFFGELAALRRKDIDLNGR
ncbi:hypothetical protein [Streptomyces sp. NPDC059092]|uniref:hypothetical protein n=1 Tax=Streptomyces sp. NPDC059092 TaxID=3346725 RepID=UPI0036C5AE09